MKDTIAALKTYRREVGVEIAEAQIREWANCRIAEFGDDGWIWIEGPQRGHWLSPEGMEQFRRWLREQGQ